MQIDSETLAQNYRYRENAELLAFHASGTLTEMAYEVLEKELNNRGVPVPERPNAEVLFESRPQSLKAHWQGKASLANAYWLLGVLGNLILFVLSKFLDVLVKSAMPNSNLYFWILIVLRLLGLSYYVFSMVSIWRCAWNSNWKGWGYIARSIVIISILTLFI